MKDRAQIILETAARDGVCQTGKRYLKQTPKDTSTLIKLMKAWPEYVQEHPDSALDIIRQNMDDDLQAQLTAANIFIDYHGSATIGSDTAVIVMGDSSIKIDTVSFAVTKIYCFNNSRASITPGDSSIIDLEAWNRSQVIISENESAITTAHVYDQAEVVGVNKINKKEYQRGQIFNGKEINHK